MKIAHIDKIICFDINTINKLYRIEDMLIPCLEECINSAPYYLGSVTDYFDMIKTNIEMQNKKFKLTAAIDTGTNKLVHYCLAIIVEDDGFPACLIHSLYSRPGLTTKVADATLPYIDKFALDFKSRKMIFHSARSSKAFGRLGKKYNWKPMRVVFERQLDL